MTEILLSTINAKYIHPSLGLRYIYANMGSLQNKTNLYEFQISQREEDIVEQIININPTILGLGVYIWNEAHIYKVLKILKSLKLKITILLGGPEVSYESATSRLYKLCDYIITGEADLDFFKLCSDIINLNPPLNKIIHSKKPNLDEIQSPYPYYLAEDIKNKLIYVESSRGCPFQCEFCISSLDKLVREFNIVSFIEDLNYLWNKGVRKFKFIDRTFNIKIEHCKKILSFFYSKLPETFFIHFEIVPDRTNFELFDNLSTFPEGFVQFEVGIQSFNPYVCELINRKQNIETSKNNLLYLINFTNVIIHSDLIVGLPGENLKSFQESFDTLYNLKPHKIQVGILKLLKGAPIKRHIERFELVFNHEIPYEIIENNLLSFLDIQQMKRFARYFEIFYNSNKFIKTINLIIGEDSPFNQFMRFSNWLYEKTGQTNKISKDRQAKLLIEFSSTILKIDALKTIQNDYISNKKDIPYFLQT